MKLPLLFALLGSVAASSVASVAFADPATATRYQTASKIVQQASTPGTVKGPVTTATYGPQRAGEPHRGLGLPGVRLARVDAPNGTQQVETLTVHNGDHVGGVTMQRLVTPGPAAAGMKLASVQTFEAGGGATATLKQYEKGSGAGLVTQNYSGERSVTWRSSPGNATTKTSYPAGALKGPVGKSHSVETQSPWMGHQSTVRSTTTIRPDGSGVKISTTRTVPVPAAK